MDQINPRSLTPHPVHDHLYGVLEPDDYELSESIFEHGVIQPVLITSELMIVAGHRRVRLAIVLGIEFVPYVVVDGDEDELLIKLIESNRGRPHSVEQQARELYLKKCIARRRGDEAPEATSQIEMAEAVTRLIDAAMAAGDFDRAGEIRRSLFRGARSAYRKFVENSE